MDPSGESPQYTVRRPNYSELPRSSDQMWTGPNEYNNVIMAQEHIVAEQSNTATVYRMYGFNQFESATTGVDFRELQDNVPFYMTIDTGRYATLLKFTREEDGWRLEEHLHAGQKPRTTNFIGVYDREKDLILSRYKDPSSKLEFAGTFTGKKYYIGSKYHDLFYPNHVFLNDCLYCEQQPIGRVDSIIAVWYPSLNPKRSLIQTFKKATSDAISYSIGLNQNSTPLPGSNIFRIRVEK